MNEDLKNMTNAVLVSLTKNLVKEERRIQVDILLHLKEIERRQTYLEMGYGSLFEFVTKELGYSESAGYRRIQAMRLIKSVPQVQQKIVNGTLTLTTAAQVQTFIKSEEKQNGPINKSAAFELIATVESKSSREVEKHLLSLKPNDALPAEKVRQVTDTYSEIKLFVPDELKGTLDKLRLLLSHVNPEMSYQDLFSYLANKAMKEFDSKKVEIDKSSLPAPEVKTQVSGPAIIYASDRNPKRTRYIPAVVRKYVWSRDQGCCSFKSEGTGKVCGSKYQIQVDHIKPFALGGDASVKNLRLLCGQHNRLMAKKVFGDLFR